MSGGYPRAMAELAVWARANGITIEEARQRFAQYAALCGIVSIPRLRQSMVFKGGNALDFVWQPNRSTLDLDFSLDMERTPIDLDADALRGSLARGLAIATQRLGVVFVVNRVRQQPPGQDKTFVTFTARVAFALPDERLLLARMANNLGSPHVLPIDISINEPIGASTDVSLDPAFQPLRVSTVEDIVGEKLRSLLQQPIRNRNRRQDVLDIAVIVQTRPHLDRDDVAAFLLAKAAARGIPVSKAAFHDAEIAERARVDYDALRSTTRTLFLPFEEAFPLVLKFVDALPLPDS